MKYVYNNLKYCATRFLKFVFNRRTMSLHTLNDSYHDGFIKILDVPTRVVTLGGWIEDERITQAENIILVIPGNPGLVGYYESFMTYIHLKFKGVPVWGIGHAGHEMPPVSPLGMPPRRGSVFTLEGQVRHKVAFVTQFVPKTTRLILIGHSIGAKISLDVMDELDKLGYAPSAGYLLFPTIERMAETPNGRKLAPMLGPFRNAVIFAAHLAYYLPGFVKRLLIRWVLNSKRSGHPALMNTFSPSGCSVETTMRLLHPRALEKSLFMAHDELQTVKELDRVQLHRLSSRLRLYYGTKDAWSPLEYHTTLKASIPHVRSAVCEHGMEHAFVLSHSHTMAELIVDWICQDHPEVSVDGSVSFEKNETVGCEASQ